MVADGITHSYADAGVRIQQSGHFAVLTLDVLLKFLSADWKTVEQVLHNDCGTSLSSHDTGAFQLAGDLKVQTLADRTIFGSGRGRLGGRSSSPPSLLLALIFIQDVPGGAVERIVQLAADAEDEEDIGGQWLPRPLTSAPY